MKKKKKKLTENDIPESLDDILDFIKTDPIFQAEAQKALAEIMDEMKKEETKE
jgi:hypothetical protein